MENNTFNPGSEVKVDTGIFGAGNGAGGIDTTDNNGGAPTNNYGTAFGGNKITGTGTTNGGFKVCSNNLPEKTSTWTKIKNVLFYEIKVELTPKQQKVEDDINAFLGQEITWGSVKKLLFKEITFGKKK